MKREQEHDSHVINTRAVREWNLKIDNYVRNFEDYETTVAPLWQVKSSTFRLWCKWVSWIKNLCTLQDNKSFAGC